VKSPVLTTDHPVVGEIGILRQQQAYPTRASHSIINKVNQLTGTMNADATTHFLSLPLASRDVASPTIAVHTDTLIRGVNKAPLSEKGLKNQTAYPIICCRSTVGEA
jgi:hypothetical protein